MKAFDLCARVAIVTGGNGGIGLGMARGLASAGARVVVAGRNAQKNAAAAKEIGGIAIEADLTRGARQQVEGLNERTPAGLWGAASDLADIAVFLASAAPDFLTGTAIAVDGGYSVQGQARCGCRGREPARGSVTAFMATRKPVFKGT
jgi:NAD(P)-dependent dehydrogenase (short-subunit alcohol dehydrogenase family)